MTQYRTAPVASSSMPKGIPYIIGNEAAERFSFYGMKAILVVFMTQYLYLLPGSLTNEPIAGPVAIEKNHMFIFWVYFTPIIGALLADIFLGKYRTIIALSLVYCGGHAALALMGISNSIDPALMLMIGLGLIALGSGGIKPCVSAHVGDQFGKTNANLISKVFGWFYFSINTGAFLSTMLTPWLLDWYGPHWAFGIPGVLMAIATFCFWMGRKVFIHVPAGGVRWFKETFSWVGIRAILKLMVIYLFVAVFWALFDQTSSSWVLQAEDMDRNWLGVTWLSSQIQAVNPIMILLFIPIFVFVVYPLINKVFKLTPIRKISIGLFVMVIGFGIIAIVQQWIDQGLTPSIGWQILAYAILTASEVMVSITCLEFSYTQAPRTMKSVIMALFLMSVALGSFFTASVASFIVVEDHLEPAKMLVQEYARDDKKRATLAGTSQAPPADQQTHDKRAEMAAEKGITYTAKDDGGFFLDLKGFEQSMSDDDIRIGYAPNLDRVEMEHGEVETLNKAIGLIGSSWEANGRLPLTEQGDQELEGLKDLDGNIVRYRLINRSNFEVFCVGQDQVDMTVDDLRAIVSVTSKTGEQKKAEKDK